MQMWCVSQEIYGIWLLKMHMPMFTHTGDRPYTCDVYHKQFTQHMWQS